MTINADAENTAKPSHLLINVDGRVGSSKTFVIRALSSALQNAARFYGVHDGKSPVLRFAPTGSASYEFVGQTVHSLLNLPVGGLFYDLNGVHLASLQKSLRGIAP